MKSKNFALSPASNKSSLTAYKNTTLREQFLLLLINVFNSLNLIISSKQFFASRSISSKITRSTLEHSKKYNTSSKNLLIKCCALSFFSPFTKSASKSLYFIFCNLCLCNMYNNIKNNITLAVAAIAAKMEPGNATIFSALQINTTMHTTNAVMHKADSVDLSSDVFSVRSIFEFGSTELRTLYSNCCKMLRSISTLSGSLSAKPAKAILT